MTQYIAKTKKKQIFKKRGQSASHTGDEKKIRQNHPQIES